MYTLTDEEVRSCIQFSSMFDKTYARTAPMEELRKHVRWLKINRPDAIPEHLQYKLYTRPIYDVYPCILCILSIAALCVIWWGFAVCFMYSLTHLS